MLPATGTSALLDILEPHVPDEFINTHWPRRPSRGPRPKFSSAQLWRLHLLALLTPVHAFNLLLASLPEQRRWRGFAHLANRRDLPDVRMLHEFRQDLGVGGFRQVNDFLRSDFIEQASGWDQTVALIDATDLPAACRGFKKKRPAPIPLSAPPWVGARLKPGKANALSVTRNTPCACGGGTTVRACC